MKKKVLIIFKYLRANWNPYVIKKFSNYYETEHLYISEYKNKNFTEIVGKQIVTIPMHANITENQVDRIISLTNKFAK